jgi:hypothetical protein
MRRFLIENKKEVSSIVKSWEELQSELEQQVKSVGVLVGEQPNNVRQWIYGKLDLVHDFTMPEGIIIAVDCWLQVDGFRIRVWKRKGKVDERQYLDRLQLFQNDYSDLVRRYNLDKVDWNDGINISTTSSPEEIAELLTEVLKNIRFIEKPIESFVPSIDTE